MCLGFTRGRNLNPFEEPDRIGFPVFGVCLRVSTSGFSNDSDRHGTAAQDLKTMAKEDPGALPSPSTCLNRS